MRPSPLLLFLLLVTWLLLTAACERKADLDIGPVAAKLVVTSYISPQDSVLVAFVSRSIPLTGARGSQQSFDVKDARVEISDGTNTVQLLYKNYYYTAPAKRLPIRPGQTYFLHVTTPAGLEAMASCTVPAESIPVGEVALDSVITGNQPQYFVAFNWADPPGQQNYYEVVMQMSYQYLLQPDNVNVYGDGVTPNEITQPPFVEDGQRDGADLQSPRAQFDLRQRADRLELRLDLLHEDIHMYTYRQGTYYTSTQGEGSLFVTPQNLYSNVQSGFGVFGAYNRSSRRIRLR